MGGRGSVQIKLNLCIVGIMQGHIIIKPIWGHGLDTLINVDKDRKEDWHFNNIFFQDFLTFAWVKKLEVK